MVNKTELQVNMAAVVRIDDTSEGSVFDLTEAKAGRGEKKEREQKTERIVSRSYCVTSRGRMTLLRV
jgi:hypothetical protein